MLSLNDLWQRYLISALPEAVGNGTENPEPGSIGSGGGGSSGPIELGFGESEFHTIHYIANSLPVAADTELVVTSALTSGLYYVKFLCYYVADNVLPVDINNINLKKSSTVISDIHINDFNNPGGQLWQELYMRITTGQTIGLYLKNVSGDTTAEALWSILGNLTVTRVGD